MNGQREGKGGKGDEGLVEGAEGGGERGFLDKIWILQNPVFLL